MDSKTYKKRWFWDGTSLKMTISCNAPKLLVKTFDDLKDINPKDLEPGTIAHTVGDYQEKASAELGPDKIWYYTNSETGELETIQYIPPVSPVSPDEYTLNMRCLTPEEYGASYKSLYPSEAEEGAVSTFILSTPSQMPYPYAEEYDLDGYTLQCGFLRLDADSDLYNDLSSGNITAEQFMNMPSSYDGQYRGNVAISGVQFDPYYIDDDSERPSDYSLDHVVLQEHTFEIPVLTEGEYIYCVVMWVKIGEDNRPIAADAPLIVTKPFEYHETIAPKS